MRERRRPRAPPKSARAASRPAATRPQARAAPLPEPSAHEPSRPISTVTASYRSGSSSSSTERAEASEISCSLERPPMSTATRTFRQARLTRPRSSSRGGANRADDDRHGRAGLRLRAAGRILRENDAVEGRIGRVLLREVRLEAGVLERGHGRVLVERGHVRHRHCLRAARDRERDRRALRRDVSPPAGDWSMTVPAGWFESTSRRATAKPAPWSCAAADSYGCPSTDGTPIGFGPAETLIRTVVPSVDHVARLRVLCDHRVLRLVRVDLVDVGFSFAAVSAATASSRESPAHVRHLGLSAARSRRTA